MSVASWGVPKRALCRLPRDRSRADATRAAGSERESPPAENRRARAPPRPRKRATRERGRTSMGATVRRDEQAPCRHQK